MANIKVSVIVPTYNREHVLCDTLKCLFKQDYPCYEIIVIDQTLHHTDEVMGFLEDASEKKRILWIKGERPNLPNARNKGIQIASGEIIVFCDDDVLIDSEWLSNHVKAHNDKNVKAVVGGIYYPPNPDLGIIGYPIGKFLSDGRCTGGFARDEPAFVDTGEGANMSFHKSVFEEVGYFDDGFIGIAIREESDFFLRLKHSGYRVYFDPSVKITHLKESGGCRTLSPAERFRDIIRNETRFFLKNFPLLHFPLFLRRFWKALLIPSIRFAIHSRKLSDAFPGQIGFILSLKDYIKYKTKEIFR